MYAPERHQQILETARAQGRVDVAGLARELSVTPETVRRDLTALERLGSVQLSALVAVEKRRWKSVDARHRDRVCHHRELAVGGQQFGQAHRGGAGVDDDRAAVRQLVQSRELRPESRHAGTFARMSARCAQNAAQHRDTLKAENWP